MQIIIPMSGFGERFKKAGYTVPKPLIEVDGYPIIQYVVDMFPGEENIIFICNQEHLDNPEYKMEALIKAACPTARIVAIQPHKLGPVYAVKQAYNIIDDNEPCIVNYCDFTCDWNYFDFKKWVDEKKPAGVIPAYKGFHPHSLGSTYYAYIREHDLHVSDIQEKKPFTETPINEYASSGTYYFASGKTLKHYFDKTIEQQLTVNNEFYVSMVYKPMIADKLDIQVYPLEHFMQWGTPADLREYLYWSKIFNNYSACQADTAHDGLLLMPMVGAGSRFQKEGYDLPKPLIPVSGKAMFKQALFDLPQMTSYAFVIRTDIEKNGLLINELESLPSNSAIIKTQELTEGQAISCLLAKECITKQPLLISACDNGVIYNAQEYQKLLDDSSVDVIVWSIRGYPNASKYPQMYGWIEVNQENDVLNVSVKKPLMNPESDPIIIGTFTFKNGMDFIDIANLLIENNDRVNNEFYVDSCINYAIKKGLKCKIFEVDSYVCWGTPNDLKTFEYWQTCFHHWPFHPYTLNKDNHMPQFVEENI